MRKEYSRKNNGQMSEEISSHTQLDNSLVLRMGHRKKRVKIIIAAVVCCISVMVTGGLFALKHTNNDNDIVRDSYSEYNSFMEGFTDVRITDEETAIEAVASVADVLGIDDAKNELKISSMNTVDGDNYYRIQQYYNDIPVYGKTICLVSDSSGQAVALTSNFTKPNTDEKSIPEITNDEIAKAIGKYLGLDNLNIAEISENDLVYYFDSNNTIRLAYNIIVSGADNIYEIIIDAKNAEIMSAEPFLDNESANVYSKRNHNLFTEGWRNDDNSYHLYNEKYNISIFDFKNVHKKLVNESGEEYISENFRDYGVDTIYSKTDEFEEDAVLLLDNLIKINDYYKKLGFNGFYQIHACLHDSNWRNNAAGGMGYNHDNQKCAVIFVGEGSETDSAELIGHEFTHAVTKSIVGWNCEAAGLNEGLSDIFGELYEYLAHGKTDWVHGSRIIKNPSENNYPQSIDDENRSGKDDAHAYSTVISYTAYLMWNGINGNVEMKIDCDTLAKLWYRALFLMQSNATFSQCRNAVELSARIMLRNKEITEEQYQTVISAFEEVGIENATFTFSKTVKNSFDLSVLSSNGTEDVNYKLEVIQMPKIITGPEIKNNQTPKTIMEKTALEGRQHLDLEDGIYVLRLTDISDERNISKVINIKIFVDGDNNSALDKVVIHTDFSDIITVVLNEEGKAPKKLKITDFLGLEFGDLVYSYGENYDICDADGWIPSSPSEERMIGYKNIPFSFLVRTGRAEPLIPYENDKITDVMFSKSLSTENYSIDGKINTDITWLELQNSTTGTKWTDGGYYAYSYKIENLSNDISVIFKYVDIPNENSIADFIIVTDYFDVPEEDWVTNTLYQPIIEKYRNECEVNHSNYSSVVCCTWFLFDVDNNGVDELIIQDGGAEQAKYHHYYTIKNNEVTELGEYSAWHMSLYEENGDLFGKVVSPSGPTELYKISITDNKVEKKLIKTTNDVDFPPYSNPINPMDISYDIGDYI